VELTSIPEPHENIVMLIRGAMIPRTYGVQDMAAPSRNGGIVRFGPFGADLAARELRRQGHKIRLQEQPFRVPAALLQRPGEVITREELGERSIPG
jgi:DNA-binding response OmpR family regulator